MIVRCQAPMAALCARQDVRSRRPRSTAAANVSVPVTARATRSAGASVPDAPGAAASSCHDPTMLAASPSKSAAPYVGQ